MDFVIGISVGEEIRSLFNANCYTRLGMVAEEDPEIVFDLLPSFPMLRPEDFQLFELDCSSNYQCREQLVRYEIYHYLMIRLYLTVFFLLFLF